jgi:hypothetical protein
LGRCFYAAELWERIEKLEQMLQAPPEGCTGPADVTRIQRRIVQLQDIETAEAEAEAKKGSVAGQEEWNRGDDYED